ncbi:MAG: hypothetical protein K2X39_05835, partial [Silvanigrellaceae bacterium]|nr:hypothetical protein [Silvanigrellaceae bacterium]
FYQFKSNVLCTRCYEFNYKWQEKYKTIVAKEEKSERAEENLRHLSRFSQNVLVKIKAKFELALFIYHQENKDIATIKVLLKEVIALSQSVPQAKDVYYDAHLFLADLLTQDNAYEESEALYKNVISMASQYKTYSIDTLRPYLGLGDSLFSQFRYQDAFNVYLQGFQLIKDLPILDGDEVPQNEFLGIFRIRLIWSAVHSAQHEKALEHLLAFARECYLYENILTEKLINNIIESGAIALYEFDNIEKYIFLAKDVFKNDLCKQMVCHALLLLIQAGRADEADDIAETLQKFFFQSSQLLNLIDVRLKAIDKDKYTVRFYDFCYESVMKIKNNSFWKSKVTLTNQEEEFRKKLLDKITIASGTYFYSMGMQGKIKAYFEKSKQIYTARLEEYIEGESRGRLLMQAANSAFHAEDLSLAWQYAQASKLFYDSLDTLRMAHFLSVSIARSLSKGCSSRQEESYQRYENVVDEYLSAFPDDPQARLAFFESAKRAEYLGDFLEAKRRFFYLLEVTDISSEKSLQEVIDLEKISLALTQLLQKIPFQASHAKVLSSLQKIMEASHLPRFSIEQVSQANAVSAKNYAQELKRNGKEKEAAYYLAFWAQENPLNLQSPQLMVEAIEGFALLQLWELVYEKAEQFGKYFPASPYYLKAQFWKARANKERLLFRDAAFGFESVAVTQGSDVSLSLEERIYAFESAKDLYFSLGNVFDSARMSEKLAQLQSLHKLNLEDILRSEFDAALRYYSAQSFENASRMYRKIKSNKKLSTIFIQQANLGEIVANIGIPKQTYHARVSLDKFIKQTLIKIKLKKMLLQESFLDKAVHIANYNDVQHFNYDFYQLNTENYSLILPKLETLYKRLKLRRHKVENYINTKEIIDSNVQIAKIALALSQEFRKYAQNKNDKMLLKSIFYYESSKKYFYSALAFAKNSSEDKIFILQNLGKEFPLNTGVKVLPNVKESKIITDSYLKTIFSSGHSNELTQALNAYYASNFYDSIELTKQVIKNKIYNKYKTFIENYSNNTFKEASFLLALCYMKIGDKVSVLDILEQMLTVSGKWSPIYVALSDFYFQEKQYDLSYQVANRGIDKSSDIEPKLYILKSRSLRKQNKNSHARKILDDAALLLKDNQEVENEIAIIDYLEEKYSKACEKFNKFFEIESTNNEHLNNYVACLLKRHEWENADWVLNDSFVKNFIYPEDYYYLKGIIKNSQRNYQAAQDAWQIYLKMAGNDDREKLVDAALNDINILPKN